MPVVTTTVSGGSASSDRVPLEQRGVVDVRDHAQRRGVPDRGTAATQGGGELGGPAVGGDEHDEAREGLVDGFAHGAIVTVPGADASVDAVGVSRVTTVGLEQAGRRDRARGRSRRERGPRPTPRRRPRRRAARG